MCGCRGPSLAGFVTWTRTCGRTWRLLHPRSAAGTPTRSSLMERVTDEQPRLWATVVGFGQYHYRYASGREGDAPAAGFAPRKAASTVCVPDGVGGHSDLLEKLGPHSTGVGCIYIKDLQDVELGVLEAIVTRSYAAVSAGTYAHRA